MKSIVTREDMALKNRIFQFDSPEQLPISYEYDGHPYRGIPANLKPKVSSTVIDSDIVLNTFAARLDENVEIRAEVYEYRDYAAAEVIAYFANTGNTVSKRLRSAQAVDMLFPGGDPLLYHGNGDTMTEDGYEWYRNRVSEGIEMKTVDGTSCNGAFPYMRLLYDGFGINIAVGWPAGWSASFADEDGAARVKIGQSRFDTVLYPGETMRTPRVCFIAYTGDELRGMNMWRRWYFSHVLPRENGRPLEPKCCMHTFMAGGHPEFTGITEENQLSGIDDYLKAGVRPDVWWIDAGWYPCNYDWTDIGTWEPDRMRLPKGLGPVGEKCAANGMSLLLWFEPERARNGSELANEHPEWLLRAKDKDGEPMRDGMVYLGNAACRAWIANRVDRIIKESGVSVYRQDMNFFPGRYFEQNETEDRVGAIENLHAQGYLAYWDELRRRNPNLLIDSCASGGRRNDLETMRRAVPFHYTDIGYGNHPLKQKQHRQMFEWIPYFRAHNMSWDRPDGTYGNENAPIDEFAYQAALTPALTDMTEHDASPEAMTLARKMQALWRKTAKIMLDSDYYPLTECRRSMKDWYAMQFHNPDTDRGFFQVLRNIGAGENEFHVCLRALTEGKYILTDSGTGERTECTADELRNGFAVSVPKRTGTVFFYGKIDND